jgi:EmrB/QacA subfamily drug resistance transporter
MKLPCDETVSRSANGDARCRAEAKPWILAATILGSSLAFIDSTVVNVALPALQTSFHATVVGVQWVVESYGLFLAALILVGGSLGDLFGRRRVFVAGVAIFALASVMCGVSSNISELIIARSIQGVGAALLVPGSLAIISNSFDETSRGQAIGTWSGFTAITSAMGPVLGGWLVQHASWRWAFFINLPIAAAVVGISFWKIPESRSATLGRLDWWGVLLATCGLGGIVSGFIESADLGWRNPLVLGSLMVGIACLVGFAIVEARATSPMVPLALFKSFAFSGANLITLFLYAAIGIFFFLLPLNLIQVQGYSSTATGAAMLPMILLMFLLSRWSGGLIARYGARLPLIAGPMIAGLGFVMFTMPSMGSSYWRTFFPAIIMLGFGMAATVAPLTTVVMSSVDQDRAGTASGINNAVARVAGVLAIAVFGIVLVMAFSSHLNHSLVHLSLPSDVVQQVHNNEIKLAGAQPPDGLDPGTRVLIKEMIGQAFIFGFRIVIFICAGLSLTSAAIAWLMIPANPGQRKRS